MGEAYLLRSFQRCFERLVSSSINRGDILDHDNSVIDDKAGGYGERHEGEIIEAETEKIHNPESAYEGDGYGNAGNDSRRQTTQKEKDDEYDEGNSEHQFKLHIMHRGADRCRSVRENETSIAGGRALVS